MGCIKQVHLNYRGKAITENVENDDIENDDIENDDIENELEIKDNTWNKIYMLIWSKIQRQLKTT